MFLADNGGRGIAVQWAAELTLLLARLGRWGRAWLAPWPDADAVAAQAAAPAPAESPAPAASCRKELSDKEWAAVERLRQAAAEAGVGLDELVEDLLAEHRPDSTAAASAMVAEVKGLFERLATDIPSQLARGMESAFRDLVPRLGNASPRGEAPPAAAGVDLVLKPAAPREVASYQSRRGKSTRVKL